MGQQLLRRSAPLASVASAFAFAAVIPFVVLSTATPARAGISQALMFRNVAYAQTANGNAVSFESAFLTFRLLATGPDEYTIVQAFHGGPTSPVTLAPFYDSVTYDYDSSVYNTRAAMDIDFPQGTYTYTANNPATSDAATTMFDYSFDAYSQSLPYLDGTNYADLQGMNPVAPFGFQFSPFVKDAQATDPELFFTIHDAATNAIVFSYDFQPDTTTGATLPADTLLPNHDYYYELDFSDRLTVASPGADFPALLAFDTRTNGAFTTGVPEPASAASLFASLAPVAALRRRRSRPRCARGV